MSQHSFSTWKAHFEYLRESDSFSEMEKGEVLSGLEKLREVFDDAWLKEASERGFAHPLKGSIANYAPWSQFWVADFGRKLDSFKVLPGFEALAKRLRNSREYPGAEAEVETIAKLMSFGITDIELSPMVEVKGKPKKPDVKARVDGEDVYFEIAALGDSEDAVKAWETHQELRFSSFDPDVVCFFQVHKILSKPHREDLKAKIQKATSEVKETKEHCYVGEPDVLDFLAIHRSKQGECEALVKCYGMKKEISGPPVEINDTRRLNRRLRKKRQQLPEDKAGIIVVSGGITFYFGSPESFFDDLVHQVEKTIFDKGNLILGVIINTDAGRGQATRVEKPNYVLVRKSRGLLAETVIIIKNKNSKFTINEKILSAFTN